MPLTGPVTVIRYSTASGLVASVLPPCASCQPASGSSVSGLVPVPVHSRVQSAGVPSTVSVSSGVAWTSVPSLDFHRYRASAASSSAVICVYGCTSKM